MPPVALGREWSGGRLKEISGGLKTAQAESKKKVEGDFPSCPVVKKLPCNVQAAAAAKSLQSCPTLCDPMDHSPLGSSVQGIFQARVLEWGVIAFNAQDRGSIPGWETKIPHVMEQLSQLATTTELICHN